MTENDYKKILILRFGAIGDVVLTTALFRSIKNFDSDAKIHYVTFRTPSLLIQNDPDLEKVWILEGKTYKQILILAKELKKEYFDVFINLQPSIKTWIFGLMLRAKKTLTYKKTFKLHAVENFWKTAKPIFKDIILDNKIKIYLPEEARKNAKQLITSDKKLVCFNTGANSTRQGRKWALEHWIYLAKNLIEKYNCQIILTGSEEDAKDANVLIDISPNIKSFCGQLSLVDSAALLEKCDLVISGDTGPLHIATALGTPVIGLYGSMLILRTGPYGKNNFALKSDMECIPCNRRKCKFLKKGQIYAPCMIKLKPHTILKVIEENSLI